VRPTSPSLACRRPAQGELKFGAGVRCHLRRAHGILVFLLPDSQAQALDDNCNHISCQQAPPCWITLEIEPPLLLTPSLLCVVLLPHCTAAGAPLVPCSRPRQVSDVAHQDEVVKTLTNALETGNVSAWPPGTLPPGTLPPGTLPPGTLPPWHTAAWHTAAWHTAAWHRASWYPAQLAVPRTASASLAPPTDRQTDALFAAPALFAQLWPFSLCSMLPPSWVLSCSCLICCSMGPRARGRPPTALAICRQLFGYAFSPATAPALPCDCPCARATHGPTGLPVLPLWCGTCRLAMVY